MESLQSIIIKHTILPKLKSLYDLSNHSIEQIREKIFQMNRNFKIPKKAIIEKTFINSIPVQFIYSNIAQKNQRNVILYIHSGAFCFGYGAVHSAFSYHIATVTGVKVLAIDYRLAPENPYPSSIDDCVSVYKGLLEMGYNSHNIIVGGDSAGACIALFTLLKMRDIGISMPAGVFFLCIFGELVNFDSTYYSIMKKSDLVNSIESNKLYVDYFWGPYAKRYSPIESDFSGMPPMLIQAAEHDVLSKDSFRLYQNANSHGMRVTFTVYKKMWHVFQMFCGLLPEANKALREIGGFCKNIINN